MLNLPKTITKTSTGETLNYTYDATGQKLRKVYGSSIRDYIGGIEYSNNTIEFIQTEEGRAIPGSSYTYEYMIKDHLGNTKAMVKQNGEISQVQDYYAFGLEMNPGNAKTPSLNNLYRYNGKEKQTELSLDQLDYGARFYDPTIGRWNVIDPLGEKHHEINPYNYVINNPMSYIDPLGLDTSKVGSKAPIKPLDDVILDDGSVVKSALPEVSIEGQNKPTPTSLDPSTVGKNLFGGTYAGGDNPRNYDGSYTYAYIPIKPFDPPGIGHDRRFDNLGAEGLMGLLTDTRTIGADWQFVKEEIEVSARNDISNGDKAKAYIIGTGLGLFSLPKTVHKLSTPGGLSIIKMWYNISNKGVTNTPSK